MPGSTLADELNRAAANFVDSMMERKRDADFRYIDHFAGLQSGADSATSSRNNSNAWDGFIEEMTKLDGQWRAAAESGKREDWVDCFQGVLKLAGAMAGYEKVKAKELNLDLTGWYEKRKEGGTSLALMGCGANRRTREKFGLIDGRGAWFLCRCGVPEGYIKALWSGTPAENMPKLDKQKALSLCKSSSQSAAPQTVNPPSVQPQADRAVAFWSWQLSNAAARLAIDRKERGLSYSKNAPLRFFRTKVKNATALLSNSEEWKAVRRKTEELDRLQQEAVQKGSFDAWVGCFQAAVELVDAMAAYEKMKCKELNGRKPEGRTAEKFDVLEKGRALCASFGVPRDYIQFAAKRELGAKAPKVDMQAARAYKAFDGIKKKESVNVDAGTEVGVVKPLVTQPQSLTGGKSLSANS